MSSRAKRKVKHTPKKALLEAKKSRKIVKKDVEIHNEEPKDAPVETEEQTKSLPVKKRGRGRPAKTPPKPSRPHEESDSENGVEEKLVSTPRYTIYIGGDRVRSFTTV